MVAINGWTWSETMLRCPISTKGPKVCQENIPHTITPPPEEAQPASFPTLGWGLQLLKETQTN